MLHTSFPPLIHTSLVRHTFNHSRHVKHWIFGHHLAPQLKFSMYKTVLIIRTNDIIASINNLRARGTEFLDIPDTYYDQLRKRLKLSKVKVEEDLDALQKLKILIDYDDNGYLLQVRAINSFPLLCF